MYSPYDACLFYSGPVTELREDLVFSAPSGKRVWRTLGTEISGEFLDILEPGFAKEIPTACLSSTVLGPRYGKLRLR